ISTWSRIVTLAQTPFEAVTRAAPRAQASGAKAAIATMLVSCEGLSLDGFPVTQSAPCCRLAGLVQCRALWQKTSVACSNSRLGPLRHGGRIKSVALLVCDTSGVSVFDSSAGFNWTKRETSLCRQPRLTCFLWIGTIRDLIPLEGRPMKLAQRGAHAF